MSCQTDQLVEQAVVDSLEFAREGRVLAGSVKIAVLSRLADVLVDDAGSLVCELRGGRDGEGRSTLNLKVGGTLELRCQRCLSSLSFELAIDSALLLVAPGASWPDEDEVDEADDEPDAIEASRELAVLSLIEDEVLLALPIAPRHENCRPPAPAETEPRPSPFAALARLKDH